MRRFASHYVYLPENGFLKQYVVELEAGYAIRLFPLTEEIESVEWLPGVIVLISDTVEVTSIVSHHLFREGDGILYEVPRSFSGNLVELHLSAYLLFPFDFTSMQPVAGTRHRQLL